MPYCRNCGREVRAGDRFCQHCGERLGGGDGGRSRRDHGRPADGLDRDGRSPTGREDEPGSGNRGRDDHRDRSEYEDRGGDREPGRNRDGYDRREGEWGEDRPADRSSGQENLPHDRRDGVGFALSYPVANGPGPALISGALLLGGFLIVPLVVLAGYSYRVGRAAALGLDRPPEYGDWGGLFVDGLRFAAVGVVASAGVAVPWVLVVLFGEQNALFALLAVPLYLGTIYVVPAFFVAFLGTGSVVAAFASGHAWNLLRSRYYAKSVLFAFVLQIALGFVVLFLVVTILGWIWGYAYTFLAGSAFWGYVYYRAASLDVVQPADAGGNVGDRDARTAPRVR